MQNLKTNEIFLLSESYKGGLKGMLSDLRAILLYPNKNNLISKKTRMLARRDADSIILILRGRKDGI